MNGSFPVASSRVRSKRALAEAQRRPRWRRMHPATRYAILFAVLSVLIILGELVFHSATADPRDPRAIAERELTLNTLAQGEHVQDQVSVFMRPGIDYFRATRGLLVLTDRRLIFLGLRPRDLLAPPDAPPTFAEHDFAVDTLVRVSPGRAFLGLAKGIVIRAPDGVVRLGVPADAWPDAERLIAVTDTSRERAVAQGMRQRTLQHQADSERSTALANWRKPHYYTVQRGDALGSVATEWNVTAETLQRWNHLPDAKIRLGQSLLVRPGS